MKQQTIKKSILAIAVVAFTMGAKAQTFYVQGGLNLANITRTNDGQTEKNNVLPTFNVGFIGDFGLSTVIDIETGLLFTGRGAKAETYYNGGSDYVKAKFNPLYVELPVNLKFKIPLDAKSKQNIFFYSGPYIAMGVAGKSKIESNIGIIASSSTQNIKFSNDDPFTSQQEDAGYNKLKRFDYGINLGGGFTFNSLILKANYGIGLVKINSTESNNSANDKNKYRTFSISIGIPLNK